MHNVAKKAQQFGKVSAGSADVIHIQALDIAARFQNNAFTLLVALACGNGSGNFRVSKYQRPRDKRAVSVRFCQHIQKLLAQTPLIGVVAGIAQVGGRQVLRQPRMQVGCVFEAEPCHEGCHHRVDGFIVGHLCLKLGHIVRPYFSLLIEPYNSHRPNRFLIRPTTGETIEARTS